MKSSELVTVDFDNPDSSLVERAAEGLRRGNLLVAPTETRYGLLMRADRKELLHRLYALKKRRMTTPTALFLRDYQSASTCAETNRVSDVLAGSFLPGPLTLVLKAAVELGEPLVINGKIGIRVSSAPFVASLIERVDFPVTATSANVSGGDEFDTVAEIAGALGDDVDLYLDAGPLAGPVSTVVDCSTNEAKVLRQGAIPVRLIEDVLKKTR